VHSNVTSKVGLTLAGPPSISDLLSYEGCLSVDRPRTLGGERKKN